MLSAVKAGLGWLVQWLLGRLTGDDPSAVDLADSSARAQERQAQAEKANEIVSESARARAGADLRVVQSIAPDDVDAAANDALKQQFPDQFRD